PEAALWESFFDAEETLSHLMPKLVNGNAVEFGCGYGTFTIPAASRITGTLFAFDIEPEMVALTAAKAGKSGMNNVRATVRDFVTDGTGLPSESVAYAMFFNILHAEQPEILLGEAHRVLATGGLLGIMHWNYDSSTPRGPSMAIRPRPERCRDWAITAGFELTGLGIVPLPPYHYGIMMRKSRQC